jgi:hypothetical protein
MKQIALLLLVLTVSSCFPGIKDTSKEDPFFARADAPCLSPINKYLLQVNIFYDKQAHYSSFRIYTINGYHDFKPIFEPRKYFSERHTTYYLWDKDDRVWIYSGDIGIYYWEQDKAGNWLGYGYNKHSPINPPAALIKKRPQLFEWIKSAP